MTVENATRIALRPLESVHDERGVELYEVRISACAAHHKRPAARLYDAAVTFDVLQ